MRKHTGCGTVRGQSRKAGSFIPVPALPFFQIQAQGRNGASGDKGGDADDDVGARAAVQQDGAVASGNCGGCHTRAGEERKHAA